MRPGAGILAAMTALRPRVRALLPALVLTLVSLELGACVSAKEYDELAADLAKARDELTAARTESKDLSVALQEAETAAELLGANIADLEDQLRTAEVRAQEAETELAGVLKDKSNLSASVEEMQQALAELQRLRAAAEVRAGMYRSVLNKFKTLIDNGTLKAKIVDGRMVLELRTDILFDSGKAKLSDEGAATVREVGKLLAELSDRRFQVEGHTDNVPIKTKAFPSNWELASARAITVVNEMIAAGMPATNISAAAYADTRPAASNATDEGRAQNRRIEIVLIPDLSDLPGAEDIEKMFNGPQS